MDVDQYMFQILKDSKIKELNKLVTKQKDDLALLGIAIQKDSKVDLIHLYESCYLNANQMSLALTMGE